MIKNLQRFLYHVIQPLQGLLRTIRHFENRRGEGPGDEVRNESDVLHCGIGDCPLIIALVRVRPAVVRSGLICYS